MDISFQVSHRLSRVPSSPIRKLVPLAMKAKKDGVKVYHLNIGDPDTRSPEEMLAVLKDWNIDPIGYDHSQGNPELLEALASYYHQLGHTFINASNIQVTTGGSEAISMVMFATANPGEEILTFEPLYTNYNSFAAVNGITLRAIPTAIDTSFHLPERNVIEQAITKKTKAILISNPNNPTGTVYTKEEIEMLVTLAKKKGLFLLSDEVYREYVYDGRKHVSILSFMHQIPDQAILLDSMSKRYSLCGIRVGALVTLNSKILQGVLSIAQGRLSSGLVDQKIAAKLTAVSHAYTDSMRKEFELRRDTLYDGLRTIPGVVVPKPEGAFYAVVKLPVDDTDRFCTWLLTDFRNNNETLMLAPASGFYVTPGKGKNEVRIAYVLNVPAIKRCIDLLHKALIEYMAKN